MSKNRIDRISEMVGRGVADAIRICKDPRVSGAFISITHCNVTGDLRYAKVHVSVMGSPEQQKEVMKGLKSAAGWLRREVGNAVQLRYAPELLFELDASIVQGAHINQVISDLERAGRMGTDESADDEETV